MNSTGDFFTYCKSLDKILKDGTAEGVTGKNFSNLGALSTQNNLIVLRNVMMELAPASTLEIGMAFGGSALVFAASHRDLGRDPSQQHSAIDPFQRTVWDGVAVSLLERERLRGYVDLHEDRSYRVLPLLLGAGKKLDLAYVDGSHLFEDVFIDCFYAAFLLNKGGFLLLDDSTDRHVRKVIRFIDSNLFGLFRRVDLQRFDRSLGLMRSTKLKVASLLGWRQLTGFEKIKETQGELRGWNSKFGSF